jgi:hypothetical protein
MIKTLSPFTHLMDHLFCTFSRPQKAIDLSQIRCIFITCPPRSGGTLVYQSLARTLPSVFLCNAHAVFPSLGTKILRAGKKRLRQLSFNNFYGYTSHLIDVYEGNEFLRWAHKTFSGLSNSQIKANYRNMYKKLIQRLAPLSNECVIFKNARAYSVVKKIHKDIPEIVFVRVRRERSQVIESVVRAYYDLGYFHPTPNSLRKIQISDPIEYACAQIDAIEISLDKQFSGIRSKSKFEIQYEEFCNKPYDLIRKLAYDFISLPPGAVSESPALNDLIPSERKKVSEVDREKIRSILNQRIMNKRA